MMPKTSSAVGTAPAQGLSLRARVTQTAHMSTDSCSQRPSISRAWHWLCSTLIRWEICKDLVTTPRVHLHVNYTLSTDLETPLSLPLGTCFSDKHRLDSTKAANPHQNVHLPQLRLPNSRAQKSQTAARIPSSPTQESVGAALFWMVHMQFCAIKSTWLSAESRRL